MFNGCRCTSAIQAVEQEAGGSQKRKGVLQHVLQALFEMVISHHLTSTFLMR